MKNFTSFWNHARLDKFSQFCCPRLRVIDFSSKVSIVISQCHIVTNLIVRYWHRYEDEWVFYIHLNPGIRQNWIFHIHHVISCGLQMVIF